MYQHIRQVWRKPDKEMLRAKMTEWRGQSTVNKLEHPTRLDRARSLGYKAKKGFVIVRVRVLRGGRRRPKPNKGRKTRKQTIKLVLKMNYQWVAEQRAQKKFPNLEVLNSYKLGKDGHNYFFDVILVDYSKPEIKNDPTMNWITKKTNQNRVFRGLTSAGRKSRGLRSFTNNKVRPSLRAKNRQGK